MLALVFLPFLPFLPLLSFLLFLLVESALAALAGLAFFVAAFFAAAVCFGASDGIVSTTVLTRLGVLADDVGLFPRESAFQFFQVVNVLMTCASFVYGPQMPLNQSSLGQVWTVVGLSVVAAIAFCSVPVPSPKRLRMDLDPKPPAASSSSLSEH